MKRVLTFLLTSVVIFLAISIGLILSDRPKGPLSAETGLDFSEEVSRGGARTLTATTYMGDDGSSLVAFEKQSDAVDPPLLILVHGSGWHSLQFDRLAQDLSEVANVINPDLRGHGTAPERRGDVDYIGQLEDDLAALIRAKKKPGQKVVLAGHSSGGGLVVRFAGGEHRDLIDGAILMAPFLKYNAPTTRPNSGGWARPLTRRIIGLSMLNAVGIRLLNHLTVIEFRMPEVVRSGPLGDSVTDSYSFRLNTSFAPRSNYESDIKALPEFLLVVGSTDEAFVAEQFEPLMSALTDKGEYEVIDGVNHLGVVHAPETKAAIRGFLGRLAK